MDIEKIIAHLVQDNYEPIIKAYKQGEITNTDWQVVLVSHVFSRKLIRAARIMLQVTTLSDIDQRTLHAIVEFVINNNLREIMPRILPYISALQTIYKPTEFVRWVTNAAKFCDSESLQGLLNDPHVKQCLLEAIKHDNYKPLIAAAIANKAENCRVILGTVKAVVKVSEVNRIADTAGISKEITDVFIGFGKDLLEKNRKTPSPVSGL